MTKEEVKKTFTTGKKELIANALKEYFAQEIASGAFKPLEFYKPNQENIIGEKDIVEEAQDIFETQGVLLT